MTLERAQIFFRNPALLRRHIFLVDTPAYSSWSCSAACRSWRGYLTCSHLARPLPLFFYLLSSSIIFMPGPSGGNAHDSMCGYLHFLFSFFGRCSIAVSRITCTCGSNNCYARFAQIMDFPEWPREGLDHNVPSNTTPCLVPVPAEFIAWALRCFDCIGIRATDALRKNLRAKIVKVHFY